MAADAGAESFCWRWQRGWFLGGMLANEDKSQLFRYFNALEEQRLPLVSDAKRLDGNTDNDKVGAGRCSNAESVAGGSSSTAGGAAPLKGAANLQHLQQECREAWLATQQLQQRQRQGMYVGERLQQLDQ